MKLGVVGIGSMGQPMLANLHKAHGEVHFWRRSKREYLPGIEHENFASLIHEVTHLLVMLPDLPDLTKLITKIDDLHNHSGLTLIIGSTCSPAAIKALKTEFTKKSLPVEIVDCPVSGGVEGASAGKLSIFYGGPEEKYSDISEILKPCGSVWYMGSLGAGQLTKLCNQIIVASTMVAISEVAILAEHFKVDTSRLFAALAGGYAGSKLLESKAPKLVNSDYTVGGAAKYMTKDLNYLYEELGEEVLTKLTSFSNTARIFNEILSTNYADQDLAAVKLFLQGK